MFWIALAAQISAPTPVSNGGLFTANDIPEILLRQKPGYWVVPIRMTVSPDGKSLDCAPESKGPFPQLDSLTCKIMLRRAKMRAASIDGVPAYGVYRTYIVFTIGIGPLKDSVHFPDLAVALNRLPEGLKSPALVRVQFVVDPTGAKSSCGAEASFFEGVNNHPDLVPVACDQVLKDYVATPAMVSGVSTTSVQGAFVEFTMPTLSPDK